jgi:hypothetical protein
MEWPGLLSRSGPESAYEPKGVLIQINLVRPCAPTTAPPLAVKKNSVLGTVTDGTHPPFASSLSCSTSAKALGRGADYLRQPSHWAPTDYIPAMCGRFTYRSEYAAALQHLPDHDYRRDTGVASRATRSVSPTRARKRRHLKTWLSRWDRLPLPLALRSMRPGRGSAELVAALAGEGQRLGRNGGAPAPFNDQGSF